MCTVYVYLLCTVQTALRYLRVLLSEITEYKLLIFPKNIDTSAVMRVIIKVERLWAEQDNYIDLLESQLRQSEEKGTPWSFPETVFSATLRVKFTEFYSTNPTIFTFQ